MITTDRSLNQWADALKAKYPTGLAGPREALSTALEQEGLPLKEAKRVAEALEKEGYAHHLPGGNPRWFLSRVPLDLKGLLKSLKEEFQAFVGPKEAREEALLFIVEKLAVDKRVAEEILTALEAAGYAALAYDPHKERERFFFRFPETLRIL
ncbi:hypothetical protein [Thermus sp.]|uniref:hypothetical protein n=1 Tax=Thermus sp. TaxID=275 RepID=UPI00331ACDDA